MIEREGTDMDKEKTLGQVAQKAFDDAWRMPGKPADSGTQAEAWQAAAEAVAAEVTSKAAINEQMYYSPMSPIRDEERAVIEAAKAWAKTTDGRLPLTGEGVAQDKLYIAIEALEEVSRGE